MINQYQQMKDFIRNSKNKKSNNQIFLQVDPPQQIPKTLDTKSNSIIVIEL